MYVHFLYEKTLKQSMVDKKINDKDAQLLKKICNHYLDKWKEIMKNTEFKVEDIFGDILNKNSISQEQIPNINIFLAKLMWI